MLSSLENVSPLLILQLYFLNWSYFFHFFKNSIMIETKSSAGTMAAMESDQLYLTDYDAIVKTIQYYIDGCRAGSSELMRPGFYPGASLVGYVGSDLLFGSIQQLYDWIDGNGPAPDIKPQFASIEILNTIAVVR